MRQATLLGVTLVVVALLGAGVATTLAATGSSHQMDADTDNATVIRLEGNVSGWYAVNESSDVVNGTQNPTLNLTAGENYTVQWTNLDGQPHNFALETEMGEVLLNTTIMSEQGATQNVTFTANESMTTYRCQVHPTTMVGNVSASSN